ncbi:MAG: DUF983 domain-containing protein [Thermomicrobiales bacterium]
MADPGRRNLPARGWPRARTLIWRAMTRRCPYCGARGIFSNWFSLRESCPNCGAVFVREEGYFLGAYALNLIVAEFIGLGVVIIILFQIDLSLWEQEFLAVGAAIVLPVLFFPFARTLWMALDLVVDPETGEKRLRGEQIDRRRE